MNKWVAYSLSNVLHIMSKIGIDRNVLQQILGRKSNDMLKLDIPFAMYRVGKGLHNFKDIFQVTKKITSMLEFGTGAHGIDLMIAYLLGIKKIYTVDINNHINPFFAHHPKIFNEYRDDFSKLCDMSVFDERLSKLNEISDRSSFLQLINCTFMTFHEFRSGFGQHVDLWYSESNLQRIPSKHLRDTLKCAIEALSMGGVAFHRLDVGDIYTQPRFPFYIRNMSRFEFLTYNECIWKLINNDTYSSQNRYRVIQYDETFKSYGLNFYKLEYVVHKEDIKTLSGMHISDMFSYLPVHELAVANARIIYRKGVERCTEKTIKVIYDDIPDNW